LTTQLPPSEFQPLGVKIMAGIARLRATPGIAPAR
jgi:hypothetical protein